MSRAKKYWKNTNAYQRLLEILDDYWLTEPDELAVCVRLEFLKANGERQAKEIRWLNPNYESINPTDITDSIISLADIKGVDPESLWDIKLNHKEYRKKEN